MKKYIYLDDKKRQIGPIPESVLKQMVQAEILSEDARIWTEGFPTWLPFSMVFPAEPAADITPIPASTSRGELQPTPQGSTPSAISPDPPPYKKIKMASSEPPPYTPREQSDIQPQTPPPPPHREQEDGGRQAATSTSKKTGREQVSPTLPPPPPVKHQEQTKRFGCLYTILAFFLVKFIVYVGVKGSLGKMGDDFPTYNFWSIVFSILESGALFGLLFFMAGKQRAQQIFSLLLLISAALCGVSIISLFIPENVSAALCLLYLLGLVFTLHYLKFSVSQIAGTIAFIFVLAMFEGLLLDC